MDGNVIKNVERFQELADTLEAEGFDIDDLLSNRNEIFIPEDDAEFFFKLAKKWDEEIYMTCGDNLAFMHNDKEYLTSAECGIQSVIRDYEFKFKVV